MSDSENHGNKRQQESKRTLKVVKAKDSITLQIRESS